MVKMTLLYLAAQWSAARTVTITHAFAFSSSTPKSILRRPWATTRWSGHSVAPATTSTSSRTRGYSVTKFSYLSMTSDAAAAAAAPTDDKKKTTVPITLLSGFLGSGKTCTLQHLLDNTEGVKIGVIVNDVASVNIDAKLVSSKSGSTNLKDGVVELQNGCACCSLADELLTSVEQLLTRGTNEQRSLDAVVVELSGVADPMAIKSNWNAAKLNGHPVTDKAEVSQIVTLVDAATFGTDWMTWDVAGERPGWVDEGDECAAKNHVPELLAEQIEAANVLLINKVDMAGPEQVVLATALARQLNEKAVIEQVSYGRVSPKIILRTETSDMSCNEPGCTDPSHEHSHSHAHDSHKSEAVDASCNEPGCTDPSHEHSHSHSHDSHKSEADASCSDPDCTDPTHEHSHLHSHASTSTDQLGITNFVYKADRPFNTRKLLSLLSKWPVPIKDELDLSLLKEAQEQGYEVEGELADSESPFIGVLRSKGFCWFAPTKWNGPKEDVWRHDTAMYWSHAGKHFGIETAGKWWGTISKDQMKSYFKDNMDEYDRIVKEDFVSDEFGDRRQEIVFIGVGIDEDGITKALDSCLLSEEKGMVRYRQELGNFMNTVFSTEAVGGPSLFDVGGVDHMDVEQ